MFTNKDKACLASKKILKDGYKVGYMYREEPESSYPDSGWRFFAGDETDEYTNDPTNFFLVSVGTVCNIDIAVEFYIEAQIGSSFVRSDKNTFVPDDKSKPITIFFE